MIGPETLGPELDAEQLLITHWARKDGTIPLPIDPIAIARKLHIGVFTAPLEEDVSGKLFLKPGHDPEIYLNESDNYNRQRFTCAHEMGHWNKRLAAGVEKDEEIVDYRGPLASTGTNSDEIYANRFAAALLMPAEEIERLRQQGYGPVPIADKLRVSPEAASFRLANLSTI
jgi:Zn-dependent peptidase ImmA (M78 family)